MYMEALYPKEHDEYLVDGAILECSMATLMPQVLRGKLYQVNMPSKWTVLKVAENQKAKCCSDLRHATVVDCEKNVNIEPFQCNCKNAPHTEEEWRKLLSDSSCLKAGTCKALMNLNKMWDNLPVEVPYLKYKDDKYGMVSGINMTSMLFCRHGGIITPVTSGQSIVQYDLMGLKISANLIALFNTSLEPATVLTAWTQGKIQGLCVENGVLYFDESGYQRVRNTGLDSDPYMVALAEYYSSSAIEEGKGNEQGYGAIFKVTLSSGKELFVTMGDLKDPAHTKESMEKEQENYYAGEGDSANTLEFICNFSNKNKDYYSENMDNEKGTDRNTGKANSIMEGASITDIELLLNHEIEWETYFEEDTKEG